MPPHRFNGVTVFWAFALLHAYEFALGVDVGDFESGGFGDAEAGAVAGHPVSAVLQTPDMVEEQQPLFLAEDDRELMLTFGAGEILGGPGHFERSEVKEFQAGNAGVHALRRQLPFVEQTSSVFLRSRPPCSGAAQYRETV